MAKKTTPLEKTTSSLFDAIPAETLHVEYDDQTLDAAVGKRLSTWAIVSLVFGVLGFLSLVHLGFLVFSVIAAFTALVAICVIGRSGGELVGGVFAATGLTLAIASGFAGPFSAYVYEREFDRQADAFCRSWFDAVKSGNPALPRQMTAPYWQRTVFRKHSDVVSYWRRMVKGEEEEHQMAHSYLCNPTLLTLAHLGDRAKVTYYRTTATLLTSSKEQTERIYAVTVEPEKPGGKRQTFFLPFFVEREVHKTPQGETMVGWVLHSNDHIPLKLGADGLPAPEQED